MQVDAVYVITLVSVTGKVDNDNNTVTTCLVTKAMHARAKKVSLCF